jgi:quinol monooxygenase YgiN
MAVAIIQEWAAEDRGTKLYDAVGEQMDIRNDPPAGLLFHTAGFVDDRTWRIFDVWESRAAFQRFMQERLMPAIQAVAKPEWGARPPDNDITYELHNYQGVS